MSKKQTKTLPQGLVEELGSLVAKSGLVIESARVVGGPTVVIDLDLEDGPGQVTGEQLEAATRAISKHLDTHDPMPGAYTLEVGTAGAVRELTTPRLWRRTVGLPVAVRTIEGRVKGKLVEVDEQFATVELDGEERVIALESIVSARSRVLQTEE